MINPDKSYIIGKIIENSRNKEKLHLERANRHDYFADHN